MTTRRLKTSGPAYDPPGGPSWFSFCGGSLYVSALRGKAGAISSLAFLHFFP